MLSEEHDSIACPFVSTYFYGEHDNSASGLNTMSGDLGNVYALSGDLRNELDLKQTGSPLKSATVNDWIVS